MTPFNEGRNIQKFALVTPFNEGRKEVVEQVAQPPKERCIYIFIYIHLYIYSQFRDRDALEPFNEAAKLIRQRPETDQNSRKTIAQHLDVFCDLYWN